MNLDNLILATDSYKMSHREQYPEHTETVYSYLESRKGAAHPHTLFFGLQYIIRRYLMNPVTWDDIEVAMPIVQAHLGNGVFNYDGWSKIISEKKGKLPIRIKAVPEGTVVPTGNVLMTVENTDPEYFWLTNYIESLLLHVWYPTTVATASYAMKQMFQEYLALTANGNETNLPFQLHDFGYRGVSSHESAAIGGAAHLVSFRGTDTMPALLLAQSYYDADLETLGFSVPATEHSVMTAMAEEGEHDVVSRLIDNYPTGILSVVNDSYDFKRHVGWLCTDFKDRILARDGVFVTRPDSVPTGESPASVVVWIAQRLWEAFGGTHNYVQDTKILDPHIRILWGDGIEAEGIEAILKALAVHNFSAENIVFGMGGGLLQKVNRDTENFSIKSSAQKRDGIWYDIFKDAPGKHSKRGKLKLTVEEKPGDSGKFHYVTEEQWRPAHDHVVVDDLLRVVYEDGVMHNELTFDEIRANVEKYPYAL
jgi:nicotinamide phosphoribosyltransferase